MTHPHPNYSSCAFSLFLYFVLFLGGCNNFLAQRMVAPPNGYAAQEIVGHTLAKNENRLPIPNPPALLAFWILEPPTPPKGTILVLHGFITDHHQVQRPAKALQKAGYRAVLVDLRGHGKSTSDHISYGVNDAHDLAFLTDYLQKKNLCGPALGVYGNSLGAAAAILFAAADPRVTAIVAVAPFASLREEAPYFGKHVLPLPGLFMSPDDFTAIVNQMGRDASFDPDACSPLAAITQTKAQILLIHGTSDRITSSHASEELAAAAPTHSELVLMKGKGHLDLCVDFFGALQTPTRNWFDQHLAEKTPVTVSR